MLLAQKKDFVRIYGFDRKTGSGKIVTVSDTSITLKKYGNVTEYNARAIMSIKTKRSAGHNALMGMAIGLPPGIAMGAAFANPDGAPSINGGGGGLAGVVLGAVIGAATSFFKNSTPK